MQPQHDFSRSPSSNSGGALPNVDMELYELVKRQNAQLQMMQALVHSGGRAPAYGRGTNGPPPPLSYQNAWVPSAPLWHQGGAPHHQQGGGLRPQPPTLPSPRQMMNVAAQGESTLSEGRYGFRLFALESLSSFLTDGQDVRRVSMCLRQYVGSVEPSGLLVLDGIGEPKWFEPGCLAAAKGGRGQNDAQGTIRLKEPVESQFHVVQHGQLHVFVVELYDASDRLVAWSEAPADMLGEKARPLRTGLVEPAMALRFPQLRTTSSAVAGVEFFRVAWRQPSESAEKHDKRSKRKDRRRSPSSSSSDSTASSSSRSRSSSSSDDGGRHRKSKRSSKKKSKKSPKRRHQHRRRSSSDDDEDDIPKLRSDADLKQHHRSTARDDPATEIRRNLVSDFTPPPASPTPPSLRPLRTSADGPVIPAGPTPMPPTPADTPMIPCGHGPHHDLVTIAIESVSGIPLNAIATRIVLYFSRTVEAATGRELWALNDRSFYVREPDAVITQELDSSVMDPKFAAEFSLVISPHTLVVAIVESLVPGPNNTMLRAVVGHSKLPIDQTFPSGNYLSRVRVGDPRPSHLRHAKPKTAQEDAAHYEEVDKYTVTQLELSGFSRDLHQLMQAHDEKKTQRNVEPQPASMMVPAAFIKWRADSNDPRGPYRDVPGQTTRSPAEMEIQRLRSQVKSQTARQRGIVSQDKLMDLFDEVALVPAQDDTVLSNVMPYDPEKGVFILVENLRGMTEEPSLLKVVVEVPKQVKKEGSGSNASQMNFTRLHDWDSDIGVPQFLDAPFVFPNVPMDLNACVLFRVFKMIDPCMSPAGPVQPFAWGISKLFLEGGVARFGHFAIPLFAGKPPAALLEELDNTKIDQVILKWTQNVSNDHKVQYLKPRGLLTFVQGDALRTDEAHFPERLFPITRVISDDHKETEHMFPRAPPRVILIPQRSRREFPCHIDEGYKDKALRDILPINAEGQLEVSEKTFEEEMNRQIKQAFRTIALT